jgi:hypothetical protein
MKLQSWRNSENLLAVGLCGFLFLCPSLWPGANLQANLFTIQPSTLLVSND